MTSLSPDHLVTIFNALPIVSVLVRPDEPDFTIVTATAVFAEFAKVPVESMAGRPMLSFFPDNPEAPVSSQKVRDSLIECLNTESDTHLDIQRYDLADQNGNFQEKYWRAHNKPVKDPQGNIIYIIHSSIDVTDQVLTSKTNEKLKSLEPAHQLFMQSSVAIHIFMGKDLVVEMANQPTMALWDRDESIIGKPVREIFPELEGQGIIALLQAVLETGVPYRAHEQPVTLHRHGQDGLGYFNFILQPYYQEGSEIPIGVIAMVTEVTDIFNDRRALNEKERSLDLAVEIGELGVFSMDIKSLNVTFSPQIQEWFGVKGLAYDLQYMWDKIYPDDKKMVMDAFKGIARGEISKYGVTFRVPDPNGHDVLHLRSIGQALVEDGEVISFSGIVQDITADLKVRREIEKTTQRLQSVIETAPFPIGVYTGKEMIIEMVNQSILDTWGKGNTVVGKRYADVLPELAGQGVYEQLDKVFTTGEAFVAQNQRIDLNIDGQPQTFYFNYNFTPLFDASGKVYGVMNTAANVTDLNVAKQVIEQSERNFRNIILQAPIAMCLLRGPQHIVEIANHFMIDLWGKEPHEVMNKPVFQGIPDAREQGLEELLDSVYKTGERFSASERPVTFIRYGNQETIYQSFVYEPYRDSEGQVAGILAISHDVTQQVLARQQIEQIVRERTNELEMANERLQNSNSELEQFAYVASHDLQEPLRKIGMFTQMLEAHIDTTNEKATYQMQRIHSAVNRMSNLIRDILGYSQLARKTEMFEQTDLNEIFTEALADFDVILEEKGASVTTENLPTLDVIPMQMAQLFTNLISNSLKYSKPDVAPVIRISANKISTREAGKLNLPGNADGYTKLTFSDNGIGFPQEYATRIFNIFQRLHGKTQFEGTGIGLAMCKKIAENHEGRIFAESEDGKGAAFMVILPLSQSALV